MSDARKPQRGPKGHKQRGGGTVFADKGPQETSDGVVLKSWQRLPSQVLLEWTQKQKRPKPRYIGAKPSGPPNSHRKRVLLADAKEDAAARAKDLSFAVWETKLPATSDGLAREEAAMVALASLQPAAPLERVLPDPFRELWLKTQREEDGGLQKDRWYASEYEKTQWDEKNRVEKKSAANARELKKEFFAQQATQPVYFSRKMREKCLAALRNWYRDPEQVDAKIRSDKNFHELSRDEEITRLRKLLLADEQAASSSSSTATGAAGGGGAAAAADDEALVRKICDGLGFEREDAVCAIAAVRSTGETPTADLVQQWLSLHVPEDALPEKFQVKGQFRQQLVAAGGGPGTGSSFGGGGGPMLNGGASSSTSSAAGSSGAGASGSGAARAAGATAGAGGSTTGASTALAGVRLGKACKEKLAKIRTEFLVNFCRPTQRAALGEEGDVESLMCSMELFTESWQEAAAAVADDSPSIGVVEAPPYSAEMDAENLQACCEVLEMEAVQENVVAEVRGQWGEARNKILEAVASYKFSLAENAAREQEEREKRERENQTALAHAASSSNCEEEEPAPGAEDLGAGGKSEDAMYSSSWFYFPKTSPTSSAAASVSATSKSAAAATSRSSSRAKPMKISTELPAHKKRADFLSTVEKNAVTLVLGQTGCGKSTQLPQFLQDLEGSRIVCTQPRRLAAVSLARRVAQERGSCDDTVGHCVRGDVSLPKHCQVVFCTVGILIKKLLFSGPAGVDFTHLVIDEAHERSLDIDFLLMVVAYHFKNHAATQKAKGGGTTCTTSSFGVLPAFKVVVMSATLDPKIFALFPDAGKLEIPGRTFPVKTFYAPEIMKASSRQQQEFDEADGDHVHDHAQGIAAGGGVVAHINQNKSTSGSGKIDYYAIGEIVSRVLAGEYDDGKTHYGRQATLIFMPGTGEICQMCRTLQDDFGLKHVFPLHGSLGPQEQKKCFEIIPQKVVVATNVCETSITIPDVTCVIDTCRERRLQLRAARGTDEQLPGCSTGTTTADTGGGGVAAASFHPPHRAAQEISTLRLTTLEEGFCSQASIEQRKGRAGRVQPGICVRMVTRRNAEKEFAATAPAEMEFLPLENLLLQLLVALQAKDSLLMSVNLQDEPDHNITSKEAGLTVEISQLRTCLEYAPTPPTKVAVDAGIAELLAVGAVEVVGGAVGSGREDKAKGAGSVWAAAAPAGQKSSKQEQQGEQLLNSRTSRLRVTALGRHLSRLPCDVRIGKLLVYGAILGCPHEAASLAAMLSVRNPLMRPREGQDDTRVRFRRALLKPGGTKSDHCFLTALLEYYGERKSELRKAVQNDAKLQAALYDAPPSIRAFGDRDEQVVTRKMGVSQESLREAGKLQKQHLAGLRQLGFDIHQTRTHDGKLQDPQNCASIGAAAPPAAASDVGTTSKFRTNRWYMLRAACVAAFFLVKVKKPQAQYKKLASGASMEVPIAPESVRYFPLQRDPFFFKDPVDKAAKNPFGSGARFFLNPQSVFFSEVPHGNYVLHTDVFGNRDKLFLETSSEPAPLAVLLLGSFAKLEFRAQDGLIVIDDGKVLYSTGGGGGGNQSILHLVQILREELRGSILDRKIRNPKWDVGANQLVQTVKELLGTDGVGW